jgi:DnaJ-class molecular chaperone
MGKVNAMTYDNAVAAQCRDCDGDGHVDVDRGFGQTDLDICAACKGSGEIRCDTGGVNCPFSYCYCEAAWDRAQESMMGGE